METGIQTILINVSRQDSFVNASVPVTRILFVGDSTVSKLFDTLLKLSEELEDLTTEQNDSNAVIVKNDLKSFSVELHDLSTFDFKAVDEATLVIIGAGVEWLEKQDKEFILNKLKQPIKSSAQAISNEPVTTFQKKKKVYQYFKKYLENVEKLKKSLENIPKTNNIIWFLDQEDSNAIVSRKDKVVMNEIAQNIVVRIGVGQKKGSLACLLSSFRSPPGAPVPPCGST